MLQPGAEHTAELPESVCSLRVTFKEGITALDLVRTIDVDTLVLEISQRPAPLPVFDELPPREVAASPPRAAPRSRTVVREGVSQDAEKKAPAISEVRKMRDSLIAVGYCDKFPAGPDLTLCAGILQRLGGCPVETFLSEAERNFSNRSIDSAGLLLSIANRCRESHLQHDKTPSRDKLAEWNARAKAAGFPSWKAVVITFMEARDNPERAGDVTWLLGLFPELEEL